MKFSRQAENEASFAGLVNQALILLKSCDDLLYRLPHTSTTATLAADDGHYLVQTAELG